MSLKPQLEAIIYAAETPISLDQVFSLVKESLLAETPGIDVAEIKSRIRATLEELIADYSGANHGIEIRQVAGGYRMSTKPDQHDVVRAFAKTLKPPFRLSLPAESSPPSSIASSSRLRVEKLSSAAPFSTEPARNFFCASGLRTSTSFPAWRSSKNCWRSRSRATCFPARARRRKGLQVRRQRSRMILQKQKVLLKLPKSRKRQPAPNRSRHPCPPNVCKKLSPLPELHPAANPKP